MISRHKRFPAGILPKPMSLVGFFISLFKILENSDFLFGKLIS
jgi:hypothetical protein